MKNKFFSLRVLAAMLTFAFALAGCQQPSGPGENPTQPTTPTAVTGVTLTPKSLTLIAGNTATLTATVTPNDATNKAVTWATSDAAVATVANGVVTAVAEGTATITVKTADGGKTDTCAVTVMAALPPGSVLVSAIALNETTLNMAAGSTATLTAAITPNDATNKAVTWSTSDAAVATVTNGVVTAVAVGTATITVSAVYGENENVKATCAVTVLPSGTVLVSSITLNETTLALVAGDTANLTPAITPDNATDKAVTWATSDAAVATVVNGVVTAVAEGTATITVSAVYGENENVKAACAVTVQSVPGSISITITLNDADARIDDPLIVEGVLTLSRSSEPVTLTLADSDQYEADSIRWRVQNTAITGSGAEFELVASNPVYLIGKAYFVTVEALKGGVPHDYTISFKVEEE